MILQKHQIFQTEFNFFVKLFEIYGFQHFNASKLSDKNVNEKPSKIRFGFMLIRLFTMIFLIIAFIINFASKRNAIYLNPLTKLFQIVLIFVMISFGICSILESYISACKVKQLYMNFSKILFIMTNVLKISINFSQWKKKLYLKFTAFSIVVTVLYFGPLRNYKGRELVLVLGYLPNTIVVIIFLQYFFCVSFVNNSVQNLIIYIKKMQHKDEMRAKEVWHSKHVQMFECDKIENLQTCERIYNLISECVELINESFGLTALLMIYLMLITVTMSGYRLFVPFFEGKSFDSVHFGMKTILNCFNII